ncbi:MAG: 23S rRNA (pseudouridine(1915)-N(3))-methyltransferase RlmH [Thermoanaerobaculia bacterium]|nr:23S rRNA (pseudouridine(1915)-N(3))-methyltransferase RlmH [Thermoanaerobaculia bacterium]
MSRELIVAWAGRHRRDEWERLCARYRERVVGPWSVRDLPVRSRAAAAAPARRREEGRALLAALPDPCWTVALDAGGRQRSSRQMASWLEELLTRWPHPVAFLLGSDVGLSREVVTGARERLSLGRLTLPHNLARLVLYEQLYRCATIRAGMRYDR